MPSMKEDREPLTTEQAISMLPNTSKIQTAREISPGIVIGAEWDKSEIIEAIQKFGARKAEGIAARHNFGIEIVDREEDEPLYVHTLRDAHPPQLASPE